MDTTPPLKKYVAIAAIVDVSAIDVHGFNLFPVTGIDYDDADCKAHAILRARIAEDFADADDTDPPTADEIEDELGYKYTIWLLPPKEVAEVLRQLEQVDASEPASSKRPSE